MFEKRVYLLGEIDAYSDDALLGWSLRIAKFFFFI